MKTDGQRGEPSPHLISLSTLYYSSLFQYDGHCGELLPLIYLASLLPSRELFQYSLRDAGENFPQIMIYFRTPSIRDEIEIE